MKDLIKRAERFARERHAGQCRKGTSKEPYTIHLEEVATLVETWGGSHEAIAAAWLHDTVEDCPPTSFLELTGIFGSNISIRDFAWGKACLVWYSANASVVYVERNKYADHAKSPH